MNASVVRESEEDDFEGDIVEEGKHGRRTVGEEVGEDSL